MVCVVGLGNPGEKYKATRHNLGFRVADELAKRCNTRIRRREYQALTATVRIGRSEVLLLKPQTFMNLCGRSVAAASGSLGIPANRLIVVYDDADLTLGRVRVRRGGSAGGHLGVASMIEELGSREFVRIRLGIGRPAAGVELAEWVLGSPDAAEETELMALVERGSDAVVETIVHGPERTMQKFNAAKTATASGERE